MSELAWLPPDASPDELPPVDEALRKPNGLLAAGGNLSVPFLLGAYRRGVFPWYERGQPILWWSPDPRAILWPADLRISRSLAKTLRRSTYQITCDTAFAKVIEACAQPRSYTSGTWITEEMRSAYCDLHAAGWAHSFEAWLAGELVGGLYGIAIGRVFFGESMFARARDASKAAFVRAVEFLGATGIELVDCQQATAHLERFGATSISRAEFGVLLARFCDTEFTPGSWRQSFAERIAAQA
jgi:leucyl/phenylalanyl-tRNA--protein transferase